MEIQQEMEMGHTKPQTSDCRGNLRVTNIANGKRATQRCSERTGAGL